MKNQALFSLKDKSKKLKCCLLQFLLGALKVGSCPYNDYFFLVIFCVAFKYFYFLNLFLPRKPQDFAENSALSFVCFLNVGIPNLKIVLSHAHKWVSSDVIC